MPHGNVFYHVRSVEDLPHRAVEPALVFVNKDQATLKPFAEFPVCDSQKFSDAAVLQLSLFLVSDIAAARCLARNAQIV